MLARSSIYPYSSSAEWISGNAHIQGARSSATASFLLLFYFSICAMLHVHPLGVQYNAMYMCLGIMLHELDSRFISCSVHDTTVTQTRGRAVCGASVDACSCARLGVCEVRLIIFALPAGSAAAAGASLRALPVGLRLASGGATCQCITRAGTCLCASRTCRAALAAPPPHDHIRWGQRRRRVTAVAHSPS